ncbi:sensor histidine kinase [Nonomuraea aurantiaca]|uniref:sensor histidine kinase n=1 Tax=Nonomuraea aurantiaca TaxID=2878562 RepID=UPI001CD989A0|nr:HAMP domain-containing sensor histidine kinase [Nonomuraea aurantiaca]MCA2225061.1 HAMP domain-containing histidine kinase [Nonomuraea aurantiaca]
MSRLWASSLRGRVTLVAAAVATAVLIPVGTGTIVVAKSVVEANVWRQTRDTAEQVAAEWRVGDLPLGAAMPLTDPSVDLIQVVAPTGQVLATSDAARNLPALSDVWPTADNRVISTTNCLPRQCVHLTAVRASPSPASNVVYAGRTTPGLLDTRILEAIVLTQVLVLIALATWTTWLVMGRALRPVGAMRVELDAVNASDLSSRVTQPPGKDEVAQLARSVNGTLARLERSAYQQRRFASDASHELRTPIAGLRAQLESAQLYPEDTDFITLVDSALRDTDRLEAIITDLLLLARIGSRVDVVKERVDLAVLVRDELAARDDRLPVKLMVDEGVVVEGVRLQLTRVLTNLLDNAQRHAESIVKVVVTRDEGMAVLAVENDGVEIARADRESIFERFTRLDAARSRDAGGTGLGLAIARDIAVAHRGEIHVDECSGGARFVLRLPAV